MNKQIAVQLNDDCYRECDHCIIDASKYGSSMDFEDFKKVVFEVNQLWNFNKRDYFRSLSLSGADILYYQSGNNNLGDVIDEIHKYGLESVFITRGWTDADEKNKTLPFQNFLEIKKRYPSWYLPNVTISFDTYTFNSRGDKDKGLQMAKNAILGFREFSAELIISSVTSVERAKRTYDSVISLLTDLGYSLDKNHMIRKSREEVLRWMYPHKNSGTPQLLFYHTDHKPIAVQFGDLVNEGRAQVLGETPPVTYDRCYLPQFQNMYLVRKDLGVVACCSGDYRKIPPIGFLDDNIGLVDIAIQFEDFYKHALVRMNENVTHLIRGTSTDICTVCPLHLPNYV